ncbi:MAG: ECF transporter S component [Eubacteriales bacterium]|nr:ECF transporter S component [Eubacteriales bacterium]
MTNGKSILSTRQLTTVAILAAISAVLFLVEVPIVLFYKLDFSNLPVLLGTFALGPLPGTLILLLKSLLGLLHTTSQGVGELADFIMGFAMLLPAGLIYRHRKCRKDAMLGMIVGTICATLAGMLTNVYLLIPFYGAVYNLPVEQIITMGQAFVPAINSLWSFVALITGPFNLLKWVIISVLTILLYKPLSPILHGGRRHS